MDDQTLTSVPCMLTTIDNPYNPFDNFNEWFMYDVSKGYNTCSLLARISNVTDDMTQKEEEEEIKRAINDIIIHDVMDRYIKVESTIVSEK